MGGDASSKIAEYAGRALGVLSALPSRGGGFSNLANYMAARGRAMSDPNARAALTPFSAGFYNIGGGMEQTPAGPGYYAPVASPRDFMGPMMATPAGPNDPYGGPPMEYVPGQPGPSVWKPHLPALAPEAALQEEAFRQAQVDLQSPDVATRARAKQAAKIPLTPDETQALVAGAAEMLPGLPAGSTISVNTPSGNISVGSPYAGSFATPEAATVPGHLPPVANPRGGYDISGQVGMGEFTSPDAAQAARLPGEQTVPTGRGTWQNVTPPTPAKPDLRPPTLPPLDAPQPPAPGGLTPPQPPAEMAPPPAPGHVNLHAPFFRQLEAERGLPVGVLSGLAEQESGGKPDASTDLSSARGLYQITKDTARAGVSADDRYCRSKSAIARRTRSPSVRQMSEMTRAVGMHYGGPAAPFLQKVGPSGLSPAQFAASVLNKSQKYAAQVAAPFGASAAYAAEAPPPQPVAPAPPPPAPVVVTPPPQPAPVVVAAPAAPPAAPVQVASVTPPENLVAFPPPAPTDLVPSVAPTTIVLPPSAGVQLQPPGGPAPILGPGGLPIETVRQESQTGEARTYKAPEDLTAEQQKQAMIQDVQRLRGAGTEADTRALNIIGFYRNALGELKQDFPTAEKRAPFIGGTGAQRLTAAGLEYLGVDNPNQKFDERMAPFKYKALEKEAATGMDPVEKSFILPHVPTGTETAGRFEEKIAALQDGIEAATAYRTTLSQLPVEQRTSAMQAEIQRQILAQRAARQAAEAQAAEQRQPTAVVVAPQAPPPAAPPPAAAVVVPAAPSTPLSALGPQGPPEAAAVGLGDSPVVAAAANTLAPDRTLASEGLSIGGGILAGSAVAPLMPWATPLAAGAGSSAGEALQVGLEHVTGQPPAERGTLTERMGRAYARGAMGEGAGQVLRAGVRVVGRVAGPLFGAVEKVAPVLAQDLPAGTRMVETATPGTYRDIGRLLQKPEVLAKAELSPEGQETLLRAWFQKVAPGGAKKVIAEWDRLGPEAQAAMAGEQHAAMDTVVESLRPSTVPISAMTPMEIARMGTVSPALLHAGLPKTAMAVGGAELASRYAPRALLYPRAATFLSSLPEATRAASPYVSGLVRAGGQTGAALVWPRPAS
jgi:hypothetical protein